MKTTVLPDADLSSALKKAALAPGDVIHIDVVGEEELSKDFVVPTDGIIYYPLIKTVNLLGKTVKEVTDEIKERLSRYVVAPIVNVSLVRWGERKVYVYIEKESSRVVTLPTEERISISRLLLSINIPKEVNLSDIDIIRKDAQGKAQVYTFSLRDILEHHNFQEDFLIQPDDIVMLKKNPLVYVQGNVVNPGAYVIPENETKSIWEVLSLAGGPTLNADLSNIKIFRKVNAEARKVITTSASTESLSQGEPIGPDDIVIVPAKPQQFVSVYGEVTRPGMISLLSEGDRLSGVLARAGGLTEFASEKITVLRRNTEGKVLKFIVDYNAIQAGDLRHDLQMNPGDIVQVSSSIW